MFLGAISAIYIGDSTEAAPTARPPINRATISADMVGAMADKLADIINRSAEVISKGFRPHLSLKEPDIDAPMIQPMIRLLTVNPSR